MIKPDEIKYTAHAEAIGGRDGKAISDDGNLSVMLSTPKEMGGSGGEGTNPEQLFAAGYSACFLGATKFVAGKEEIKLPDDFNVAADVGIGPIDGGFAITVKLYVTLNGFDQKDAEDLVAKAHKVCPYSNATRGNVDVSFDVKV